ncbi:tRNA (uridine(34)/cytosine(34)/5-carboxymethylaminomethyluridine(34)-2'-O)-methyltransferase TrmL [Desulfobacter hydrogenophilus]|uniref:Putative tRNA (cytidine(34)-2'-O)-methyltransferase n=1 Tax=Desulfobacter hydrogenophilus TaxID=2291 RepID=A0A328FEL1_9BACT|nr:tRNA (cytidine(34)-2'-O)-methyltransferase [Desulfobacter hydrogenophilus]NDY71258.1 tRNA (cytidine(34)-2'-O)-methyltransferase [Desulfobacter hydrogenophilus]QBH15004.1 tRNA (cytidine(34)-2'-O)-methyltransferase [Desulfobacter hydrogenophilus]RAM02749.1 tRNA (uridine(34)/cytosine(34)/5-carboxymethylaminomethyluridine(34)-2'-O)-methyltransferase TrmL [Desulfobacter hydrogenophilus]
MIKLNIVLLEPEIPQNTGNIGRTCNAMGACLHLIEPLGFSIEDKYLKRAGLDYWKELNVKSYINYTDFLVRNPQGQKVFLSKKATIPCDRFCYSDNIYLIFGKESVGLPEKMLKENVNSCVRVPMSSGSRSLNIANTVAIISYEVMRQHSFLGLDVGVVDAS